jgi:hypothetical protein
MLANVAAKATPRYAFGANRHHKRRAGTGAGYEDVRSAVGQFLNGVMRQGRGDYACAYTSFAASMNRASRWHYRCQ